MTDHASEPFPQSDADETKALERIVMQEVLALLGAKEVELMRLRQEVMRLRQQTAHYRRIITARNHQPAAPHEG
ncbi:MAG TPA: hypothetical protein VNP04_15450 [Alphaproteobacteria bacterium]|nr:hypothetical protein [Alphaproteobacteria bacterium]